MDEYVNQVISTANQLNGIGFKLPELWIGMILLAGLPEDYRPMIMGLENSGVTITGDFVKTKLLQEQPLLSNRRNSQAFATNKRKENFKLKNQPTASKGPKCRKCGQYGHIARDCKDSRKGETFCTVLSTFGKGEGDDWIFDSAAYTHMTSNKQLLKNLEIANGKVVAANGGMMDIVGCGSAYLQPMCRGDQNGVTVSEVQLIPGLTANLLSVSRIVQKGYSVKFDNDGFEVHNLKGELVATGSHSNNQFKLNQAVSQKALQ
ncbi:uncharacterized protein LOC134222481 [Armigeres subalbatus]|uniref:uncharacterized protein LOC134222481 n=1 Tax=Armigeres subalbatus TaxID=124917 RepID=UPI002ED19799